MDWTEHLSRSHQWLLVPILLECLLSGAAVHVGAITQPNTRMGISGPTPEVLDHNHVHMLESTVTGQLPVLPTVPEGPFPLNRVQGPSRTAGARRLQADPQTPTRRKEHFLGETAMETNTFSDAEPEDPSFGNSEIEDWSFDDTRRQPGSITTESPTSWNMGLRPASLPWTVVQPGPVGLMSTSPQSLGSRSQGQDCNPTGPQACEGPLTTPTLAAQQKTEAIK